MLVVRGASGDARTGAIGLASDRGLVEGDHPSVGNDLAPTDPHVAHVSRSRCVDEAYVRIATAGLMRPIRI